MLVAKAFPRLSILGSPVMAFLVGVGAAVAIGGALLGTLFPQFTATTQLFDAAAIQASGKNVGIELLYGVLIMLGVVVTFAFLPIQHRFFQEHFLTRFMEPDLLERSWVGRHHLRCDLRRSVPGFSGCSDRTIELIVGILVQPILAGRMI